MMIEHTTLNHACDACDGTGHSENGMWDCGQCIGTGIGDEQVREACRTLSGAYRGIARHRVTDAEVHSFWRAMVEHHAKGERDDR